MDAREKDPKHNMSSGYRIEENLKLRSRVEYKKSLWFFGTIDSKKPWIQGGSMWAYLKAEIWCDCVIISFF